MKRTISISTNTFAAIWKDRKAGEETEDDIIARKFGSEVDIHKASSSTPIMVSDSVANSEKRQEDITTKAAMNLGHGVNVPDGFRIFKRFGPRGQPKFLFEAIVENGRLRRIDNDEYYPSLHKLTFSITKNNVNAWGFWQFVDNDGKAKPIDSMRT